MTLKLTLSVLIGIWWAYYSSSKLTLNNYSISKTLYKNEKSSKTIKNLFLKNSYYFWFFIIFLTLYFIHYPSLKGSIASVGDESAHITGAKIITEFALTIYSYILNTLSLNTLVLVFLLLFTLIFSFYLYLHKKSYSKKLLFWKKFVIISFGVLLVGIYLFVYFFRNFFYQYIDDFLRYPFVVKFFHVLFVFPDQYNLSLYRLLPFVCVVIISWILFYKITRILSNKFKNLLLNQIVAFLITLSLVTFPLIFYYSSILYIEMIMILLMTVVILDIKTILFSDYSKLIKSPSWYALLLIGFVKETAIIYLLPIILLRLFHKYNFMIRKTIQNQNLKQKYLFYRVFVNLKRTVVLELKVCVLIILPALIYLFFRIFFGDPRPYGLEIHNLFNIYSYFSLINSFALQFGIFIIFVILGLFFLFRKDKRIGYSLTFLILFITFFFICDIYKYIGYSRWNLFFVPIFLFLFLNMLESFINYNFSFNKNVFLIILFFITAIFLISNLLLVPVYPDGSRKNWGCTNSNDCDRTYPYDSAFVGLANNEISHMFIIVTAKNIPNLPEINFYLEKYNITTNISIIGLNNSDLNFSYNKHTLEKLILSNNIVLNEGDYILLLTGDELRPNFSDSSKYFIYQNNAYFVYLYSKS